MKMIFVHVRTERVSRPICVYTMVQWAAIIRTVRHKNSYHVKMDLPDFYDFKSILELLRNFYLDSERNKVRLLDVRPIKI